METASEVYGGGEYGGGKGAVFSAPVSTVQKPIKKRFLFKVYDSAGNFITTWRDVISEPSFSIEMNSGFSELVIELARSEDDYDEGVSVAYGNQLKIYAFDRDTAYSGQLIYSGILTRYVPSINGAREAVKVTFISYWYELAQMLLENAGATTVAYSSQDPTNILKDALDKFTAAGGRLDYAAGTTDDCGTSLSYTFNTSTFQEVITKLLDLAPYDWYLRVGADDKIYFKQKNTTADHTLTLGKEISDYEPEKRIENIVNTIYFIGGGSPKLYKKYVSSGSVTAYGTRAMKYIDERVTTAATADKIKDRIFSNLDEPEVRVTIKVMDNSGDAYFAEKGYDIESFKVGETVKILNATKKTSNLWDQMLWDIDSWDYDITNAAAQVLQIVKIQYTPDYAILELSNKQPNMVQRIEEINKQTIDTVTADNPSTPS